MRTTQTSSVGATPRPPGAEAIQFDAIYRRYRPDLVRYAERRGADDAEGVADLALLDLARAFDRLRSTEAPVLRAYLYKAARNRAARERSEPTADAREIGDMEDLASDAFEDAIAEGLDIDALLASLSDPQEEALRLRFYEQMTSTEAAAVMRVDASTVRTHQRRGLTRLRQLIFATLVVAVVMAGLVMVLRRGDSDVILNAPVAPGQVTSTTTESNPGASVTVDAGDETPALEADPPTGPPNRAPITPAGPTTTISPELPPLDPTSPTTTIIPVLPPPDATSPTTTIIPVLPPPDATSPTTTIIPVLPPPDPTTTEADVIPELPAPLAIFETNVVLFESLDSGRDCTALSGSNLVLDRTTCAFDVHPLWRVTPSNDGYVVTDTQGTLCWTVDATSNVVVSGCTGGANQNWFIEYLSGYRLRSLQSGRCLSVEGGDFGTNVVAADCLDQSPSHQRWNAYRQADQA